VDSSGGLFGLRDPLRHSFCRLFETNAGEAVEVCPLWMTLEPSKAWALETRGWVLQERLLALRTLKFGSYLAWECRECLEDEFGLEFGNERTVGLFFDSLRPSPRPTRDWNTVIYLVWASTVQEYSRLSLTVPKQSPSCVPRYRRELRSKVSPSRSDKPRGGRT